MILTEDVTTNLVDKLRAGDLDVIIVIRALRSAEAARPTAGQMSSSR
jgi:hypothetical protein